MRVESKTARPREVFVGRSTLADRARMVCAASIILWAVFGPPAICVASSSDEPTSVATPIAKKSDIVGKLVLLEHTVHFRQLERYFYDVTDEYIYYNNSNNAIQSHIELPLASCGYWGFPYDGNPRDIRKMIANHEVVVNEMPVYPAYQSSKLFNMFQYNRYVFKTKFAPRAKTVVERKYRLRVSVMRPDEYYLEFWAGVPLREISKKFKLIFEFTDFIPTNLDLSKDIPRCSKDGKKLSIKLLGSSRRSFFDSKNGLFRNRPNGLPPERPESSYQLLYSGGPSANFNLTVENPSASFCLSVEYCTPLGLRNENQTLVGALLEKPFDSKSIEPCSKQLQLFHKNWVVSDELLDCFTQEGLVSYVYASRGFDFKDEKWSQLFYSKGSHYFRKSDVPFSESWLTAAQKAAIEKLKGAAK